MNTSEISAGRIIGRIAVALLLVIAVFLLSNIVITILIFAFKLPQEGQWVQTANHIFMLFFSFIFILIFAKGRLSDYGFKLPKRPAEYVWPTALGFAAGVVSDLLDFLLKTTGNSFVADYSFLETALFIWLLASIAEEMLFRGLIQGYLSPLSHKGLRLFKLRISLPVQVAAILFALMHLALLTTGVNPVSLALILPLALFVGIVAGYWRERSESILPAILAHVFANVGGSLVTLITR